MHTPFNSHIRGVWSTKKGSGRPGRPLPSARIDPGTGLVDQAVPGLNPGTAQPCSGRPEMALVDQNSAESTVLVPSLFLFVL